MVQLGEYLQVISPIIYWGALIVSILQSSAMKKSMSSQSIQQAYATTTQPLFNNINSKEYLQMSQESPVVSKYYSLVDSPQQYYIIIQSFDMLEFIFRLYKTKMQNFGQDGKQQLNQWWQFQSSRKYGTKQRIAVHMNSENL